MKNDTLWTCVAICFVALCLSTCEIATSKFKSDSISACASNGGSWTPPNRCEMEVK